MIPKDNLVHNYLLLLDQKFGYINIETVNFPPDTSLTRFFKKPRDKKEELRKLKEDIHRKNFKEAIKNLSKEELQEVVFNDRFGEKWKPILPDADEEALTIFLTNLSETDLAKMTDELVKLPDWTPEPFFR